MKLNGARAFAFGSLLVLHASLALVVVAQDSTGTARSRERAFCFRGRALPACRAFAITEFGADARLYAERTKLQYKSSFDSTTITYYWRPPVFSVTGEVGAMFNTQARTALGGAVFLRNGAGGPQVGFKARYRHWLSNEGLALDAAVGVASGDGGASLSGDPSPGLTGDIAVNLQDYLALRMRVDINRTQFGSKPAVYAGVRAGSFPALGAAALVGTGFAVLFAIFIAAGGDS